jgi:hypothetical protein
LPDAESEFALESRVPGFLPGMAPLPDDPALEGADALVVPGSDDRPHDWRQRSLGYGLRAATSARGFDLSLYYWDRVDPRPVFRRRVETLPVFGVGFVPLNVVDTDYERVRSLGFAFARPLGDFAVWGEGLASHGRAYAVDDLTDRDGTVRRPDLQYALGLDWSASETWFLNLQWIQLVRFGPTHGIEVDRTRNFASLLVRGEHLSQTLVSQLFFLVGQNQREAMLRPSLEWRATDALSFSLGADVLLGPREGVFGQYAHERECTPIPSVAPLPGAGGCGFDPPDGRASRVFLRLRYAFGTRL